ncbi:MAG TPA: hypothetical protein VIG57_05090, partial [Candidatus Entotheonella sp.]
MPLKIIHVGVGGRGRHWLDFVHQHPDYQAVACVDVSETALQATRALAGQEHGQFFTDFDAAVAQVKADAALIT